MFTIFDDLGILMAFFKETIAFVQKLSIVVLGANMMAGAMTFNYGRM